MPDWRDDIKQLMKQQDDDQSLKPAETRRIARYVIIGEDLYRRSFSTPLLKCIGPSEETYVMDELHNGICGFHTGRRTLKARVLRAGYFWPTLEEDAKTLVQRCRTCQAHANIPHAPQPNYIPWSPLGRSPSGGWTSWDHSHRDRHRKNLSWWLSTILQNG